MTKPKKIELTQEELRSIFDYNPDTGVFIWVRPSCLRTKVGDIAGSLKKTTGYLHIGYNKRVYLAHRLAWVYMYGDIPDGKLLDHKDMDKVNNKANNLRLCNRYENEKNVTLRKDNTSGYKGVSWNKARGMWIVNPMLKGKQIFLGYFSVKQEAIQAHKNFCIEHHGEFYRDTTEQD
jgi:hypothetical protein